MEQASISFRPRTGRPPVPPSPPLLASPQQALPPLPTQSEKTVELLVDGMTCGNCVREVTDALTAISGVASASPDISTGKTQVVIKTGCSVNASELVNAVIAAGFGAKFISLCEPTAEIAPQTPWRWALQLGVPVTALLMIAEWGFGMGMNTDYHWIAFLLALPVQVLVGGSFYRGAWRQARHGDSSMDTLVSLGSSAAFGFSCWGLLAVGHGHLYFMESASILTLVGVGHWIEARLSRNAATTLRGLLELAPGHARRRTPHGEELVPIQSLQISDYIVLKPGDRVPVDAVVTEGDSSIDESMLTGESLPVEKSPGSPLYTGTINQNGRLVARVTATGSSTALARIIAAVQRAQSSRAQVQRLADRISSVFVPIVIALAVVTALGWYFAFGFLSGIHSHLSEWLGVGHLPSDPLAAAWMGLTAVLIVACPCAMGLATPVALMAGLNAAARQGILIRDALALEKCGRITTVIFDKTGTLTEGKPTVVAQLDLRPAHQTPSILAIANALAQASQHPLSEAISRARQLEAPQSPTSASRPIPPNAIAPDFKPTEWREHRGLGIEALIPAIGTEPWFLGSPAWMSEKNIDITGLGTLTQRKEAADATILALANGPRLVGAFALLDPLKAGAPELIRELRASGLQVRMLTGDQPNAAIAMGARVGLFAREIQAGVRPEGKADAIRDRQQLGERVAFVGDGLNDGPALAQADLGLAVLKATDVAKEAADIILLRDDLAAIPLALDLSRATLRVIHQNLFWAFFYNAAAIPLAMFGFLSPIVCALAMGFSDVIVVGNALRLARRGRNKFTNQPGITPPQKAKPSNIRRLTVLSS